VVDGLLHLAEQVAGDEHAAPLRGEGTQESPQPRDALRVEPVPRLVEDQHLRVAEEGHGEGQPLPHPQ
jgi:hypothetical protein